MDREELLDLLQTGPTRVRMNDGREYDVPGKPELWSLSSMGLHLMLRCEDGKLRSTILPLVTMAAASHVELADS